MKRVGAWLVAFVASAGLCASSAYGQARDPVAVAAGIDKHIDARLQAESIPPSPQADDAEFLRRAYLDISGRIPPVEKAADFLDSKDPERRRKLIDELLADPHYGEHFGQVWHDLIAPRYLKELLNDPLDSEPFAQWLARQFNESRSWKQIVSDILTAEGTPADNPATVFIIVNGNGRGIPQANNLARVTGHLFMGVQLECAECHDHPFNEWKQADFWGVAAFFGRLRRDSLGYAKPNYEGRTGREGAAIRISRDAFTNVGETRKALLPGGSAPKLDLEKPFRPVLAEWLTTQENPYFAPASVNRLWAHFFGRGFVNPLDGFDESNPASHPELLKMLADEFAAANFDVKHMIRCICNSAAYQRTSRPVPGNQMDRALFSRMAIKVLSAKMAVDSLETATQAPELFSREKPKQLIGQPPVYSERERFLLLFETQTGSDPTEYAHGVSQALKLMNSVQLNAGATIVERLSKAEKSPQEITEQLYLAALSRRPSPEELKLAVDYAAARDGEKSAYDDILWTLLNRSEFLLNH